MSIVVRLGDLPAVVNEGELREFLDKAGHWQIVSRDREFIEVTYGDRKRNAMAASRLAASSLGERTLSVACVVSDNQARVPLVAALPPTQMFDPVDREIQPVLPATLPAVLTASPVPAAEGGYDSFHNPYTFVPTPPRTWEAGSFAGDASPKHLGLGHAQLHAERWTGSIPIRVTAKTPLLLLRGEPRPPLKTDPDGHETFDVEERPEGSSLRGVLRNAYETITNSRYACFAGHHGRIGYRMRPNEAKALVPVLIGENSGRLVAHVLEAASLPFWGGGSLATPSSPAYPSAPKHGDEVVAEIERCRHTRGNVYEYWKVAAYWSSREDVPLSVRDRTKGTSGSDIGARRLVTGRIAISNRNVKGKHDERLFFWSGSLPAAVRVNEDVKDRWRERIEDYRRAHRDREIFGRVDRGTAKAAWDYLGDNSGKTAWSPHQYVGRRRDQGNTQADPLHPAGRDWADLQAGDLAWGFVSSESTEASTVVDLFPVTISRHLNPNSPKDLLHPSLRPAATEMELSPADRLFGWVAGQGTEGEAACKGRIRVVVAADALPAGAIELSTAAGGSLPLPILSTPKPAQGRFYVGKDKDGTPLADDEAPPHYSQPETRSLRGRKHFPHHPLTAPEGGGADGNGYWDPSASQSLNAGEGRFREFVRAGGVRDEQNRSVTGWIRPGAVLKAHLEFENLMPEEVGALVWLLSLPPEHFFRLGFGKPVGFGSARIEMDCDPWPDSEITLAKGERWTTEGGYYRSVLAGSPTTRRCEVERLMETFQKAMCPEVEPEGVGEAFARLPFVVAFLAVCKGKPGAPTHYPRTGAQPDLEGENFRWFGANESGRRRSLPSATDDDSLPRA